MISFVTMASAALLSLVVGCIGVSVVCCVLGALTGWGVFDVVCDCAGWLLEHLGGVLAFLLKCFIGCLAACALGLVAFTPVIVGVIAIGAVRKLAAG